MRQFMFSWIIFGHGEYSEWALHKVGLLEVNTLWQGSNKCYSERKEFMSLKTVEKLTIIFGKIFTLVLTLCLAKVEGVRIYSNNFRNLKGK